MKLRNKKTGEIVEPFGITCVNDRTFVQFDDGKGTFKFEAHSLAELNEEWEDYKEPNIYYFIDIHGEIKQMEYHKFNWQDDMKQIGNYFETREEAEKALEKLKTWKRLKDKGIEFYGWRRNHTGTYDLLVRWKDRIPRSYEVKKDLTLLFGGDNESSN